MKKTIFLLLVGFSFILNTNAEVINVTGEKSSKVIYGINIYGNGSTVSNYRLECFDDKCIVDLPSITRDGYIIDGFSTNKNSHQAEYKANTKVIRRYL